MPEASVAPVRPPSRPATEPWHTMTAEEVLSHLGSDARRGLDPGVAAARLAERGPNELRPEEEVPVWRRFAGQFNDFMIWVLMAAVVISALEGQFVEAVAITAILVLNGVLGFVQEYRAEQALEALKEMSAPTATVIRSGAESELPACELVPGDVVLLEAGDKVPADARLLEAGALRVEEAALTGESVPVRKTTGPVADPEASLGDREDMVFAGTSVAVGRGRGVVVETGQTTQMGRIAELLAAQEEEKTPLQRELRTVGKRIALLVLAVAAVVFAVNTFQAWQATGLPFGEALGSEPFRARLTVALLVAISLAVAAIPEGLPAIVTVALSLGVRHMAERNAIVRKLHAVETLGSTTFICSDKTGTLTRNQMAVRRILVGDDMVEVLPDYSLDPTERDPEAGDLELLLEIAASCNDARFTAGGELVGDPTETALVRAAHEIAERRVHRRRLGEIPFDSERKRMTTVHDVDGRCLAYMKGGADVVLRMCTRALLHGETVGMTEELRSRLRSRNEGLASTGYRTLAFAYRELDGPHACEIDEAHASDIERDLTYVGIMGLLDPPRPEVAEAIDVAHSAGIHVAMVTGDHALTASAIGSQIGLLEGKEVVDGVRLERMTDEELYDLAEDIRIYARVNPEHKLRIVEALKRRGHVVAMTGDGVNDAPALKRADIGVAMGQVGTDVSREAADMVLADDNFATIVEAVRQGRAVFDNLRKFILFLLSCNMSEVLIILTTTFFIDRPALLPLQILWINLVTDGLPALALGVDPASPRVMQRAPRRADEGILVRKRQLQVLWQGALLTTAGLSVFVWADYLMAGHSFERAQTMLFAALVLAQLLHAFNFRSETVSVFTAESLRNRWLVYALFGSMALQVLVIYLPPLQRVFRTVPLSAPDWLAVLTAALLPIAIIDLVKVVRARRAGAAAA
ncbi:MAG: cation-translocating P-type ATPase [Coriobacteriia bacterium]|nr:cation-translocating P-type ATPase [Coriobacteriia bacterium]